MGGVLTGDGVTWHVGPDKDVVGLAFDVGWGGRLALLAASSGKIWGINRYDRLLLPSIRY